MTDQPLEDACANRISMVLINRDDQTVIIASNDMPPLKFSIDHPYIQGTKLEREARIAFSSLTSEK